MMRASVSVAWVFGPPLAFVMKQTFGFNTTFLLAAICAGITLLLVAFFIDPQMSQSTADQPPKTLLTPTPPPQRSWLKVPGALLFLAATMLAFSTNHMYVTAMPLYVSKELLIDSTWMGYLMGVAAFVEIPVMIVAAKLSDRYGIKPLLMVGFLSGMLFFAGISHTTELWLMFVLQLFNGIFIGIIACLGMVFMQNLMPQQLGLATTLFNNAVQLGMLLASLAVGLVAQYHSYYAVLFVCLLGCVLAAAILATVGMGSKRVAITS
jgi:SET family sugar efflux transporter-like MFS transporter